MTQFDRLSAVDNYDVVNDLKTGIHLCVSCGTNTVWTWEYIYEKNRTLDGIIIKVSDKETSNLFRVR